MLRRPVLATTCLLLTGCGAAQVPAAGLASEVATVAVGDRPRSLVAADFDGDGSLDLATANADSQTLSILLRSDGDALAFDRSDVPAGTEPADLSVADFNGDGHADIAVANHETSGVTVLLNNGRGGFAPMPGSPFDAGAAPHLHSVTAADFDGDGHVDIACDSSDTDAIAMLWGRPGGGFEAASVPAGDFPYYQLDLARPAAQPRPTLVVPSSGGRTVRSHVFDANRRPTLTTIATGVGAMVVAGGDFNGDARPDVAAAHDDSVTFWLGGEDDFSRADRVEVAGVFELAAGDLDGDGTDELAVSQWDETTIRIVDADGNERGRVEFCHRPASMWLGDLTGDGLAELAVGCWEEPVVRIYQLR